ncbi:hypothetical protein [Kitasatospora kazusensis]
MGALRSLIRWIRDASTPPGQESRGNGWLTNGTHLAQLSAALVAIAVSIHRW